MSVRAVFFCLFFTFNLQSNLKSCRCWKNIIFWNWECVQSALKCSKEGFLQPSWFFWGRRRRLKRSLHMSIYGCLQYLQNRGYRFLIWNTYCMFIFLFLFVVFFGQVIKREYNCVSIYNVFIKFINLEHYLLLHTCQLFVNNQNNLFQMCKIANCFEHWNVAFSCFCQYSPTDLQYCYFTDQWHL